MAQAQKEAAPKKAESPSGESSAQEIKGSPLHTAIMEEDLKEIQDLVAKGGDLEARDSLGSTPLILASGKGLVDVVKLLLSKGVDVNAQNQDGATALMTASAEGKLDVVKLLLEKGAKIDALDKAGSSALVYARQDQNKDVAEFLSKSGAKEPEEKPQFMGSTFVLCRRVAVCLRRYIDTGRCSLWTYENRCRRYYAD
jgi:ankyrin repeat protein